MLFEDFVNLTSVNKTPGPRKDVPAPTRRAPIADPTGAPARTSIDLGTNSTQQEKTPKPLVMPTPATFKRGPINFSSRDLAAAQDANLASNMPRPPAPETVVSGTGIPSALQGPANISRNIASEVPGMMRSPVTTAVGIGSTVLGGGDLNFGTLIDSMFPGSGVYFENLVRDYQGEFVEQNPNVTRGIGALMEAALAHPYGLLGAGPEGHPTRVQEAPPGLVPPYNIKDALRNATISGIPTKMPERPPAPRQTMSARAKLRAFQGGPIDEQTKPMASGGVAGTEWRLGDTVTLRDESGVQLLPKPGRLTDVQYHSGRAYGQVAGQSSYYPLDWSERVGGEPVRAGVPHESPKPSGPPDYMATVEDTAPFYRTPEQMKAEKEARQRFLFGNVRPQVEQPAQPKAGGDKALQLVQKDAANKKNAGPRKLLQDIELAYQAHKFGEIDLSEFNRRYDAAHKALTAAYKDPARAETAINKVIQRTQQQQSFIGENAQDAQVQSLIKMARRLEEQGASRDEIWKQTTEATKGHPELVGAFKGADGKWRVELDDGRLTIEPNAPEPDARGRSYQVEYPHVKERYPEAMQKVSAYGMKGIRREGSYYPQQRYAGIQGGTKADLRKVAGHEIAHDIQHIEGFEGGSDPQELLSTGRAGNKRDAFDQYERNKGEVEARLVERRMSMTPEYRRKRAPWRDYDVPEEDQLGSQQNVAASRSLARETPAEDLKRSIAHIQHDTSYPAAHRKYLNNVYQYLFRKSKTSKGFANAQTEAYMKLTGGKVNVPVRISDLFDAYKTVSRDRDKEMINRERNSGLSESGKKEHLVKDETTLLKHIYLYGRRVGESFDNEVPPHAAPWLIDGDSAILSPYIPDMEGARALAGNLPLSTGVKLSEGLPKEERLIPDIPRGRIPQKVQQQQAKAGGGPPARIGGGKPPPKEPSDFERFGKKPKPTTPMGMRLEGDTAISSSFGPDQGRVGASGFKLGTKEAPRPFHNPGIPSRNKAMRIFAQVEKVVSPTALSTASRGAEQIIRAVEGVGRRQVAKGMESMEAYQGLVGRLDKAAQKEFVHYIQTGGTEGSIAALKQAKGRTSVKQFEELTNNLARIYKGYADEIASLKPAEKEDFIKNYLPQMYKDKGAARAKAATFLKERRIPTYKEALEKHKLEPITDNPIEMTMRYMAGMRRFLDVKHIVQEGIAAGYIRKFDRRRTPIEGTDFIRYGGKGGAAYVANADFTRVFNNYVSRGFGDSPEIHGVYDGLLRMSNASTAVQLGVSAFHLSTMVKESYLAAIADNVKELSKGKAPTVRKFYNSIAAPVSYYNKGDELISAYLEKDRFAITPDLERMADLLSRSNMRVGDLDEVYRASALGGYVKSFQRGLLMQEGKQLGKDLKSKPIVATATMAGRLIETVAHPLFYHYIPRLKAGVWHERMATYLRDNPASDMASQVREAQRIADVVDDQFGELMQNNIFWNAHLKQTANLLMTSTGWTMGTLRLFGQGTADIVRLTGKTVKERKAQELTDRAAYVIATVFGVSLLGAAYQYLHGGGAPSQVKDLVTPKTGAKTPEGDAERAILPGYEKDIMGWYHAPISEAYNKLNPLVKNAIELGANTDYRGDQIRDPSDPLTSQLYQIGQHLEGMAPISLTAAGTPTFAGTGVNAVERFLGARSAGGWITNPARSKNIGRYVNTKAKQKKAMHEAKDAAKRGMPFSEFERLSAPPPSPPGRGVPFSEFERLGR